MGYNFSIFLSSNVRPAGAPGLKVSVPEAADPHVGIDTGPSPTERIFYSMDIARQIILTRKEWETSEDVAKTRGVS